jgi:tRNA pseudouridine synthase 9
MALVEVPQGLKPLVESNPFEEPDHVITTPADPWPRPYFLENGLRRVAPYHFTYNTFCKERWRGRELMDIFASEFRDRPVEYYVRGLSYARRLDSDKTYRKTLLNAVQ